MSTPDVYTDTAKAVARATHPQSRDVLLLTLHTIGYLLEEDEDGLALDLFTDWATAVQERAQSSDTIRAEAWRGHFSHGATS